MASELPSHASPIIAPLPRPSSQYLTKWSDLDSSAPPTPGLPSNLLSPAFTPPSTPGGHHRDEPKSTPVDTSTAVPLPGQKQPRLLERLPIVECIVRARIPTTSGAEMFLHLYQNDSDNKEHLAIVFGNSIRSRSLDAERAGESEMDRMIRGAYVGRLRPGRTSSRTDPAENLGLGRKGSKRGAVGGGSGLRNVTIPEEVVLDTPAPTTPTEQPTSTTPSETLEIPAPKPPLVRIHSECYTGETAWSARCDCGEQLDEAARLMSLPSTNPNSPSPGGVIVYLRQEGRGIGLASKLKAYNLQDLGNDTVEANLLLRHPADARSYGLATSILVDLGLGRDASLSGDGAVEQGIRLLTNNPEKVRAVEGPGREVRVKERVAMVPVAWRSGGRSGVRGVEIERYLETKIGRMGHRIYEEEGDKGVEEGAVGGG